jgi:hypothetical protein
VSVEIKGAEQLAELSKRLKQFGDKDLQRELSQGITQAMKPVRPALRESARRTLPRKGGLNLRVARAKITTRRSRQGVRLQAGGPRSQVDEINAGRFRHPVFGRKGRWVTQPITPGWWDRPIDDLRDDVQRQLLAAMRRVAAKLDRPL